MRRRIGMLMLVVFIACATGFFYGDRRIEETGKDKTGDIEIAQGNGPENEAAEDEAAQEKDTKDQDMEQTEGIASYLQGIQSYEKGKEWSGPWCYEEAAGQQFSQFGCGLCSMANIYSSLSGKECTPLEMYEHAQEVSSYDPRGGVGAIGWDAIRVTLQKTGFICEVGRKPSSYEEFQDLARESQCLMVLVSSDEDDTFWKDMPGHYVTLWLYDEQEDQVFLADSSGPKRNRKWIPLRDAYDALKTSSPQQYLAVYSYEASEDGWVR